jgi:murein endopeptidase
MKQKITLYVLLLLVCRPVAAEPIHKPDNTTAAHPSISPKNVTGPANRLFGAATTPAPITARAIGSYARGCLAGGVSLPINGPEWQVDRKHPLRNTTAQPQSEPLISRVDQGGTLIAKKRPRHGVVVL